MISREATRKLTELLDHEKLTLFPHVSTLIVDQAADLAPGFLRQFPGVRRLTLKNAVSQNMADHPNSQGLVQLLSAAQGMPLEFASIDYEPRNWINTIPGEAYQIPLDLLPQSLRHLVLTVPQSRMDYLFNIGEGISRHHRQLARLEIKSVQDESSLQELLMGLGEHPSLEHLSLNFSGVVWYGKMSKALVRQGIDSFIAQLLNKPRLRTLELTVRVHKEYLDEGLGPFEPMRRWRTFMEEEFQRLKGELREAKVHATVKFKFYEEPK